MDVRLTAVANTKPFGIRIGLSCLPHYSARQSTRSIPLASNNRLLRVTRNIQYRVLYVLVHVTTTVPQRNVVQHVRLILNNRDWAHSRTAIMGFKAGY
jgi:hypothetical protein